MYLPNIGLRAGVFQPLIKKGGKKKKRIERGSTTRPAAGNSHLGEGKGTGGSALYKATVGGKGPLLGRGGREDSQPADLKSRTGGEKYGKKTPAHWEKTPKSQVD